MTDKTIFKYQLPYGPGTYCIAMRQGAEILSLQTQEGIGPVIWALHESNNWAEESRTFFVTGTGWQDGGNWDKRKFIGTYQDNTYVWHVFEELP